MDILIGRTLIKATGESAPAEKALADVQIIGFYFSAHWCPPCKQFTPVLADFYRELKDNEAPFEIVFVSSDRTQQEMMSYMQELHGEWYALPLGDPAISQLKSKFSISGIPAFVVVKKDGTLVTTNGRADVQSKGPVCFFEWSK